MTSALKLKCAVLETLVSIKAISTFSEQDFAIIDAVGRYGQLLDSGKTGPEVPPEVIEKLAAERRQTPADPGGQTLSTRPAPGLSDADAAKLPLGSVDAGPEPQEASELLDTRPPQGELGGLGGDPPYDYTAVREVATPLPGAKSDPLATT